MIFLLEYVMTGQSLQMLCKQLPFGLSKVSQEGCKTVRYYKIIMTCHLVSPGLMHVHINWNKSYCSLGHSNFIIVNLHDGAMHVHAV